MKTITFVIPCYNERENIPALYAAVNEIMAQKLPQYKYDFIFADNASPDGSAQVLKTMAAADKRVRVIINNRNFGVDRSCMNAFLAARGDAAIILACDLQNPPALIPDFVKLWESGAKVVWAQRVGSSENILMKAARGLYYKIIKTLSDVKQYEYTTGWGLYDAGVIAKVSALRDPAPLMRNIIPDLGYEPALVPYCQPRRARGKSSYNFWRYFDTALSSLINTSKVPLKICIFFGFFTALLSGLAGAYYFAYKLLYWDSFSPGIAPLVVGIFFLSSVQIFFLGIAGEYILAVLSRQSFTSYVIEKERINFDD
ncbi:MAG: glycosyltransferase family 2 protein [Elusimicrobiota bacterium]|jgi:glycosyltransferase involved in cell wall biosynthesis|nr:glycosyltransferase family 2 protein [Elusimicrobiota bacterium]